MQIEIRPTLICKTRAGEKSSIDLEWVAELLRDIGRGASLVRATNNSGLSYRGAWEKLNTVGGTLSFDLVARTKGHG
jgi:putative molybdopterin biosynthesis protein